MIPIARQAHKAYVSCTSLFARSYLWLCLFKHFSSLRRRCPQFPARQQARSAHSAALAPAVRPEVTNQAALSGPSQTGVLPFDYLQNPETSLRSNLGYVFQELLRRQGRHHGRVVEIGVAQGTNSDILLKSCASMISEHYLVEPEEMFT
eukprot:scaffold266941_cov47-Prasinocladus_malaysianus.AAC.1